MERIRALLSYQYLDKRIMIISKMHFDLKQKRTKKNQHQKQKKKIILCRIVKRGREGFVERIRVHCSFRLAIIWIKG